MAQIPANPSVDVESLKPFKKFIMTIGNLPTSYLESLTYAELVMWFCNYLQETVIPAVNNNGEAVEELQGLYVELKSYVDNYFTDLDVQEEINNKLDQMAEDGTLTDLISAYINPLINAQNERINNIDAKVNSATSGSPLVASSIEEMTDTDRVYVNTTDGKWYYYDGDSWEIGGTYQAIENADGSITYDMLVDNLKNSFNANYNSTNFLCTRGYYINQYGNISGDGSNVNNYGYFEINVNPKEIFKIHITERLSYIPGTHPFYIIKNNNNETIRRVNLNDITLENNYADIIIEMPSNATKLLINIGYPVQGYILKINNYIVNDIHKNQLDEKLQTYFKDVYEEVNPTLFIENAFINGSQVITEYNNSNVYAYQVNPGEKYKITNKQIYKNPCVIIGTNNIENKQTFNNIEYTFKKLQANIVSDTEEYQFTEYEFTIPEYCNTIYINKYKNHPLKLEKSTSYKINVDDINLNNLNPLYNKSLGFVGDSVLAASTEGVKGWVNIMQENNPDTQFYNYGHDGYTIGYREDRPTSSIQVRLQSLLNDHPNLDYIIIQGGINDFYQSTYIPLGTISNDYTTFNRNSFAGGLETMIKMIRDTIPNAKIGFIATHKITYASGIVNYYNLAKQICDKWSIGYCDLFNRGQLNMLFMAAEYSTNGDGTHPNLAGYELETPQIEKWLKYIL